MPAQGSAGWQQWSNGPVVSAVRLLSDNNTAAGHPVAPDFGSHPKRAPLRHPVPGSDWPSLSLSTRCSVLKHSMACCCCWLIHPAKATTQICTCFSAEFFHHTDLSRSERSTLLPLSLRERPLSCVPWPAAPGPIFVPASLVPALGTCVAASPCAATVNRGSGDGTRPPRKTDEMTRRGLDGSVPIP
jgi:hypothetical protein